MLLTAICAVFYPLGIQAKRKGWHYLWFPLAKLIFILDIIANYTEWAVVFGKAPKSCYTISKRVDWMVVNGTHPAHREFAKLVNIFLDACERDGKH